MISFIPTVLKSNVLATESSFSMNDSMQQQQSAACINRPTLQCTAAAAAKRAVPEVVYLGLTSQGHRKSIDLLPFERAYTTFY